MIELGVLELENIGPLKSFKYNLRHRGLVLLRAENNDTTAADSNGTGKTWVLKGLTWALFGNTVDGEKTDEVIRRGAKSARARIVIHEGDDVEWDITRTRAKSGGVKVQILRNGEPATGAIIKDTQEHINRTLGMDFHTFRNTVMFGQGDNAKFADFDTPDADRKAVLKRIMRVDVLDRAVKQVSDKTKLNVAKRQEITRAIALAEAKDNSAMVSSVNEDIVRLKVDREVQDKQAKRLHKLLDGEKEVVGILTSYEVKHEEIAAIRVKRQAAQDECNEARTAQRTEEYKRAEALNALALFAKGACTLCSTTTSGEHVMAHLAQLKQKLAAADKAKATLESKAKECSDHVTRHMNAIEALESEVSDEPAWSKQLVGLRTEINGAKSAGERIKRIEVELRAKAALAASFVSSAKAVKADVEKHQAALVALEEEDRHLSFWQRGFGNAGLTSYVMDSVIPELGSRANYWLNILTDGDITVMFDTTSKLKSGEERDKLSMILDVEGVSGVRPSGGQGNKVKIAANLALGDVVASREHAALDIVCLDEVLDGLDASGKARVADLLLELRKIRSTVLVVSHDPGITEMFESIITLRKHGGETVQV